MIDCLRRHDAKKPTVPVSLRQIRADLGVGGGRSGALTEVLAELVTAGRIEAVVGNQGSNAYTLVTGTVIGRIGQPTPPQDPEDHWPDDPDQDDDDWLT